MAGPKRYSDLAGALEGINTSLLAARVKQLEAEGLAERRHLAPPIASTVYQLTPVGKELASALTPLAVWGARHYLPEKRSPAESFRAEWALVFLAELFEPGQLSGIEATYEIHADDSVARLRIHDGTAEVRPGVGDHLPDATFTADAAALAALAGGTLTVEAALTQGRLRADGDPAALAALLAVLQPALDSMVQRRSARE